MYQNITRKSVLSLVKKYRNRIGNPDVKRITEELVQFPERRHYQRVADLIPTSEIRIWYLEVPDKFDEMSDEELYSNDY